MSELDGFTGELTHKMGPLPAWAWGLGAAGAIFLVQRYRASHAAAQAPAANPGAVADPSADPSGIVPSYDASYGSVLANSAYGSAGGQSIPVPLSQTALDAMISDYLTGLGFTPGEVADATPVPAPPSAPIEAVPASPAPSPAYVPTAGAGYQVTPTGPVAPTNNYVLSSGGVQSDGVSPVYRVDSVGSTAYQINGQTVQVPAAMMNTGLYSGDLASASNPYLNPDLRTAALARLNAAGVI